MVVINVVTGDVIDTEKTEKPKETNIFAEIHGAIYDFTHCYGTWPNRITMGSNLIEELDRKFGRAVFSNGEPIRDIRLRKEGIIGEFEGIPVRVDYDNPRHLEVGYMIKRDI